MTLSDISSIGSLVSGIAVLVSLAYLSQQTRQNSKHTRALIQQGRYERLATLSLGLMEPAAAIAVAKGVAGSNDLTETEFHQFRAYCQTRFRIGEDSFFQHKDGLLGEDAFDSFIAITREGLKAPGLRVMWQELRDTFQPEFVQFIQGLVDDVPSAAAQDPFAKWKSDITVERAKASA
jgi:hypothetical protein